MHKQTIYVRTVNANFHALPIYVQDGHMYVCTYVYQDTGLANTVSTGWCNVYHKARVGRGRCSTYVCALELHIQSRSKSHKQQ